MSKVTRIVLQKGNKHRYNIFIKDRTDERYAFSVEEETLINEGLKKGQELNQAQIEALVAKDNFHKGYNQALIYLGYRMRSTKELSQYLIDKGIEPEQIDLIIYRLKKEKILDDQAFADAYVSTKVKTTFKGPEQIKRELIQKGIGSDQIDQALMKYPEEEQVELIEKWLIKQTKKTSRHSHRQAIIKMKQQLSQKGFDQSVIERAFQSIQLKKDEEHEWRSLVYQGEKAIRRYHSKAEGYELIQKVKGALYQRGFDQGEIERFIDQFVNID